MSDPAQTARSQRRIGAVILGTFVVWIGVQFLAGLLDLPLRWVALLDLIALAVLGWALWMSLRLWRARKEK